MNHFDEALEKVKADILEMWALTISQLKKSKEALATFDKPLSMEVKKADKQINALELKIDRACEELIATHNPVAVDLRFLISIMKINNNLERIGDIAKGIAKIILNSNEVYDKELVDLTEALIMIEEAYDMHNDLHQSFQTGNLSLTMSIFQRDKMLNDINQKSKEIILKYISKHPGKVSQGMDLREIILRLERIGDQCCNIAEEIVYYKEAQVLNHAKKKLVDKKG